MGMIRGGFLSQSVRAELRALLRDGHAEQRLARRANAMLLLDDRWSCEEFAEALYLDDDTVRSWRKTYDVDGLEGLRRFEGGGSDGYLSAEQEGSLKAWIAETLPRSTTVIGAFIATTFGVVYDSRSGLIELLHRLGFEYDKPETIGLELDPENRRAFIEGYANLLSSLGPGEAVVFADAVHPTQAARLVGGSAPAKDHLAIEPTSGRQRLDMHGPVDLESGKTAFDRRRNRRRRLDDQPPDRSAGGSRRCIRCWR